MASVLNDVFSELEERYEKEELNEIVITMMRKEFRLNHQIEKVLMVYIHTMEQVE